ncbi:MAG: hypothetical protein KGI38_09295 [Thaumarchaeota archaeon]|nr:hypothetical protein [Nitrososphaerota archaeon]
MTVEVSIFLFGKPAWEIEGFEGGELSEAMIMKIREKGKELNQSLGEAADTLTRLLSKGWEGTGTLYDVSLFKDISLGEARRELAEMGLDPELALEFEDDDDLESTPVVER